MAMNIFSQFWRRGVQPFCQRLQRDIRGVVAVETALLIPIGVFVIIASWELYQYFRTASVVDRAAFMVANSLSMQHELYDSFDCTSANSVCTYNTIASDLLQPLDYKNYGGMVISLYQVISDDRGDSAWSVCWSKSNHGAASQLNPPTGFPTSAANDSVIAVEVFYDYVPFAISSALWQALGGKKRIVSEVFYRPRFSSLCNLQ